MWFPLYLKTVWQCSFLIQFSVLLMRTMCSTTRARHSVARCLYFRFPYWAHACQTSKSSPLEWCMHWMVMLLVVLQSCNFDYIHCLRSNVRSGDSICRKRCFLFAHRTRSVLETIRRYCGKCSSVSKTHSIINFCTDCGETLKMCLLLPVLRLTYAFYLAGSRDAPR